VKERDSSPPVSGLAPGTAARIALRGWMWGLGIGVAAGLLIAFHRLPSWNAFDLLPWLASWGHYAAFVSGMTIPFALTFGLEKPCRENATLEHLGLYLAASSPALPLAWLCTQDRDIAMFSAFATTVGGWILLYPYYQSATGITSGLYSRYHGLSPLVSRRLGPRECALMAGYASLYCLSTISPLLLGSCLVWWGVEPTERTGFSPWGAYLIMMMVLATTEQGATLRRHFPEERVWKLAAFFGVFVLAAGSIMYTHDWHFFTDSRTLALIYVPAALFIFTMSCLGRSGSSEDPVESANDPSR